MIVYFMTSIVIYFSRTGSTKLAAEFIARLKKAEICPIKEMKDRKGLFGFLGGAREALKKAGSVINSEPVEAVKDKDKLYIGTPLWAGNGTPAVNSFIDQADFTGKSIILFTVQADPKLEGSRLVADYLTERIEKKGGKVVQTIALQGTSLRKEPDGQAIELQLENREIM